MNIHEHQAKEIFKQFNVPVPNGLVVFSIDNIKNILEISEEKYFLDDFNIALTKTLHPVGDDLIKIVYQNMGGKRTTDKINK